MELAHVNLGVMFHATHADIYRNIASRCLTCAMFSGRSKTSSMQPIPRLSPSMKDSTVDPLSKPSIFMGCPGLLGIFRSLC